LHGAGFSGITHYRSNIRKGGGGMYELIQVKNNSYYIESPAKIGLYRLNETDVCLFDSGSDKDAGRKVRQILDRMGWHLTVIYNTHSNADHIGGNQYLQKQTGCNIFAPGIECDFVNSPVLEPAFLYGGYPPRELRHKFLMAQESRAERLTQEGLQDGLELISLPGHYFDMVGFRTKDDVVYLADCLSSERTLEKYQIGFIYDVEAYLNTLQRVMEMRAAMFVPAHAPATENISALAQLNMNKVHEIADQILKVCAVPVCFEDVLQQLFHAYHLEMDMQQYVLVGSTVRSYLAWLKDMGRLDIAFTDGKLLWRAV